jgi:DNA transposition AAA+ family ATPase
MQATPDNGNIADMRSRLHSYIEESKRSRTQIARELSISPATLSLFLAGTYTGNNNEIAKKVERFLTTGATRSKLTRAPNIYTELHNTREILQKVEMVHIEREIAVISGPAGCGKTTALKHYALDNSDVIYIELDVTMSSHRTVLLAILEEMGDSARGSTNDLMRRLISKLRGSNRMIILDEAQHMTEKAFDAIRALNDKAQAALVYAGNPTVVKRMYGYRRDDFGQLCSRCTFDLRLKNNHKLDDIAGMFAVYSLSKDCLKYLYREAKRQGGLRTMTKRYKLAANIAAALGEELSVFHLDEAAKRMGAIESLEADG